MNRCLDKGCRYGPPLSALLAAAFLSVSGWPFTPVYRHPPGGRHPSVLFGEADCNGRLRAFPFQSNLTTTPNTLSAVRDFRAVCAIAARPRRPPAIIAIASLLIAPSPYLPVVAASSRSTHADMGSSRGAAMMSEKGGTSQERRKDETGGQLKALKKTKIHVFCFECKRTEKSCSADFKSGRWREPHICINSGNKKWLPPNQSLAPPPLQSSPPSSLTHNHRQRALSRPPNIQRSPPLDAAEDRVWL